MKRGRFQGGTGRPRKRVLFSLTFPVIPSFTHSRPQKGNTFMSNPCGLGQLDCLAFKRITAYFYFITFSLIR